MERDVVACPNCTRNYSLGQLNTHLDACLGIIGKAHGSTNGTGKRPLSPSAKSAAPIFASTSDKRRALEGRAGSAAATHESRDTKVASEEPIKDGNSKLHVASNGTSGDADTPVARPTAIQGGSGSTRQRLNSVAPLAERMRPRTLDDFVGQDAVVNGPLKALLRRGVVPNAILWGPPGTGKTTLARILAKAASESTDTTYRFVEISATTASTNDCKKIFDEASNRLQLMGQRTILFIDEVQRFSRAQQDIFLPVIEKGQCILIAATTENPSFRLQGALLSRMRVFVLTKLSVDECFEVLRRARQRAHETEVESSLASHDILLDDNMLRWIAGMADGDARTALGAMEIALATVDPLASSTDKLASLKASLKRTSLQYDRTGDMHYDTISALHKSIRGSNADAALYWLVRMIESGDDPLFLARRLIVAASEDCGTLESLQMAVATYQACQLVGLPECAENLAHCVVTLAESPKSTRAYRGLKKAQQLVRESYNYPVPIHIRNAPTKLMKELGNGKEYRYEPSFAHPVHQEYFPPELRGTRLLSPPPSDEQDEGSLGITAASSTPPDTQLVYGVTSVTTHKDESRRDVALHHNTIGQATMAGTAGIGPGACQRIFRIGARAVDLDLLDEWEREHNGGKQWHGRPSLLLAIQRQGSNVDANAMPAGDATQGS